MDGVVPSRGTRAGSGIRVLGATIACVLAFSDTVPAITNYVWSSGSATSPYDTWAKAAKTIQPALDVAVAGNVVLVADGTYDTGGACYSLGELSNRVMVLNPVTVRSVNGPLVTTIKGQGPAGPSAVRGVYLCSGATLIGFTVTNGYTFTELEGGENDRQGGGVWIENGGGVLSNCIIRGNSATYSGGGVRGGGATLYGCVLSANVAGESGGGGYGVTMNYCTVTVNRASDGGGTANSTLSRCVVVSNSAAGSGGGAYGGVLDGCTVTVNCAWSGGGVAYGTLSNCTVKSNTAGDCGGGARDCTVYESALTGNVATNKGGGTYGGTLIACTFAGNSSTNGGGGACDSLCLNSLFVSNSVTMDGGGAYGGTLSNCTFVTNSAEGVGGGAAQSVLGNCILWYNTANTAPDAPNWSGEMLNYCCTIPAPVEGAGNITNEPDFVDRNAGDYRLAGSSPCIDAGANGDWMAGAGDVAGNPRVVGDVVDMGAYEAMPVHYVATNGNHVSPFYRWADASTNIQAAVDVALRGDRVVVSNGVYDGGGKTVSGVLTNRVAIDRPITVRSVNGYAVTTIKGRGPAGTAGIRCVYVGTNAVLDGFTLTNGYTRSTTGDVRKDRSGGGVWCDTGAIVSNCFITGNGAYNYGGGAYSGVLYNCTMISNAVTLAGASYGGGAYSSVLHNCTVSRNAAVTQGGGTYAGTLNNCIVYYNSAGAGANYQNGTFSYSCTTPDPGGVGNVTGAPMFVNTNAGNYRLEIGSPCTNAGNGAAWMTGAFDMDGTPRIVGGRVDMGAYESTNGVTPNGVSWAWLLDNGLATDGTADMTDTDGDRMNNAVEYFSDTNPNSGTSLLQITNVQTVAQGIRLDWVGGTWATQYLERTHSLTSTVWQSLATNAPPTPAVSNYVDAVTANTSAFYRVRAVRGN